MDVFGLLPFMRPSLIKISASVMLISVSVMSFCLGKKWRLGEGPRSCLRCLAPRTEEVSSEGQRSETSGSAQLVRIEENGELRERSGGIGKEYERHELLRPTRRKSPPPSDPTILYSLLRYQLWSRL